MPINSRVRANNVFGLTTNNPLTAGATTFNSAGLVNLPVIATQHAIITLDPLRQFGEPEIVVVTAHTASSIVATITRGAYGTTARSHPINTLFVHAPVKDDYTLIATSSARPADPFEGQEIYETDTDFTKIWNGSAWEQGLQIGAWTSFTPTLTQSGAVTKTVNYAKYIKIGRIVTAQYQLTCTGSGTGANAIVISLPITSQSVVSTNFVIGSGWVFDSSATLMYRGLTEIVSTTTVSLRSTVGTTATAFLGADQFTAALATGDIITLTASYESTA